MSASLLAELAAIESMMLERAAQMTEAGRPTQSPQMIRGDCNSAALPAEKPTAACTPEEDGEIAPEHTCAICLVETFEATADADMLIEILWDHHLILSSKSYAILACLNRIFSSPVAETWIACIFAQPSFFKTEAPGAQISPLWLRRQHAKPDLLILYAGSAIPASVTVLWPHVLRQVCPVSCSRS